MKPLIFHSDAKVEFDSAISWYEHRQNGLGLEFHDDVDIVLERLREIVEIGTPYKSTEYRFIRTKRFPYLVYYLQLQDAIWIAAIAHYRRRPDYWRRRKPE